MHQTVLVVVNTEKKEICAFGPPLRVGRGRPPKSCLSPRCVMPNLALGVAIRCIPKFGLLRLHHLGLGAWWTLRNYGILWFCHHAKFYGCISYCVGVDEGNS